MKERKWCVYMHISPHEKVYIGITCQKPKYRWGNGGIGYKSNEHFWRAIQKYGWDNFTHIIVLDCLLKEEAIGLEKMLIFIFNSTNSNFGYNHSIGGDGGQLGCHLSEGAKNKIRESKIGEKNPMFGTHYKRSEDTIKRLSKSKIGNKNPMFGKNREKHHNSIPVCQCDDNLNVIRFYWNACEAGEKTGIKSWNISAVCRGKPTKSGYIRHTAGGYHWRYATEEEIENAKNSSI